MILSESTPIAQHAHACDWCLTRIVKGLRHQAYSGIWDGDPPMTMRMHAECFVAYEREGDVDEMLCGENHRRGMTCDETEQARLGEFIEALVSAGDTLKMRAKLREEGA